MTKQRIYAFDIIRTIAAYAVIIVHVTAIAYALYTKDSPHLFVISVLNRFFKFTTPVFIFLGGLMVHVKYKNKPFETVSFYKDRFMRIILPYLLFSLFYYFSHLIVYNWPFNATQLFKQIALGTAKYHLYFIITITQLYLLTPLLLKLRNYRYKHLIMCIICLINVYVVMAVHFPYADRFFLKYLFPFMVGIVYGTNLLVFLKRKAVLWSTLVITALFGIVYALTFYFQTIGIRSYNGYFLSFIWFAYTNLSIYALIIIAMWLERFSYLRDKAVAITQYSFFIYLIHPFIMDRTEALLTYYGLASVTLRFVITLITTLLLSTLLAKGLKIMFQKLKMA